MVLSIIIPVFNTVSDDFERCLCSIEKLPFDSFEVIVLDDGSKEELSVFYKKACEKRSYRYEKIANGGVSNARNYGVGISSGEYVMFIDSDDEIIPESFDGSDIGEADIVCYDIAIIKDGTMQDHSELPFERSGIYSSDEVLSALILRSCFYCPVAKVFRKSIVTQNGISFDPKIIHGEDVVFNMQMLFYSESVKYVNKKFYKYYYSPSHFDERWKSKSDILLDNYRYKHKLTERYIREKDLFDKESALSKIQNNCVDQIFRLELINCKYPKYTCGDFVSYINDFQVEKSRLSSANRLRYFVIRNRMKPILKLLSVLRDFYLSSKK